MSNQKLERMFERSKEKLERELEAEFERTHDKSCQHHLTVCWTGGDTAHFKAKTEDVRELYSLFFRMVMNFSEDIGSLDEALGPDSRLYKNELAREAAEYRASRRADRSKKKF